MLQSADESIAYITNEREAHVEHFLTEYLSFVLKTITILAALIVMLAVLASLKRQQKPHDEHLSIEHLNGQLDDHKEQLTEQWLEGAELKQWQKQRKQDKKSQQKERSERPRIFVLDFDGDLAASDADRFGREINALQTVLRNNDELVVRLESAGGYVHAYGYAAAQMLRLRESIASLTVCVDKVAASGGYMMACTGHRILAAPFAVIGSIGVVAELPNFNKLLKKHDIDYEVLTAGEYKRTLTLFGENTDQGRQKFLSELEQTHGLFKQFVMENRPAIDIEQVAKGEVWYGRKAVEQQLVDELSTSDAYLLKRSSEAEIYEVSLEQRQSLVDRVSQRVTTQLERRVLHWLPRLRRPMS